MRDTRRRGTDSERGGDSRDVALPLRALAGLVTAAAIASAPAAGEATGIAGHGGAEVGPGVDPGVSPEMSPRAEADTSHLASGPYSSMQTLLERTIFQVDVVDLTLRYDSAATARIRRAVEGREYSESVADSVAAAVLDARSVSAHLDFRRDVGLDRFLESVRDNMARARDAGMLADSAFRRFEGELPGWYSALEGRGVREGDVTRYRIRGDSLRVVYRSVEGDTLISRISVGEQHRRAVIGGYLAPDGPFREGLVRSLFEAQGSGS